MAETKGPLVRLPSLVESDLPELLRPSRKVIDSLTLAAFTFQGEGRRADVLFNPFVGWVYESIQPSCLILKILRLFMNHTSQY